MSGATMAAEELGMLADSARDFVSGVSNLARYRQLRGSIPGYDEEVFAGLVKMGWAGITVPESSGGMGLGIRPAGVVLRALGSGLCAEPVAEQIYVPVAVLSAGAARAEGDTLLRQLAQGQLRLGLAWMEAHSPIESSAWGTRAHMQGGKWRLTGRKLFAAPARDGWLVTASVGGKPGIFRVAADGEGVQVEHGARVDGVSWASVKLDSAVASDKLSDGEEAQLALRRGVETGTILSCAELLGVMSAALDMTLEYAKTRVQFGQPIGSFQAVQHRLVDMYIQRELAISVYEAAVRTLESDASAGVRAKAVSQAKARCAEAALQITQGAIQYHGAIGFTDECDIGLYLKRALVLVQAYGNAAFHRNRFAELATSPA